MGDGLDARNPLRRRLAGRIFAESTLAPATECRQGTSNLGQCEVTEGQIGTCHYAEIAAGRNALVLRQYVEPGSPRRTWRRGGDSCHLGSGFGKAFRWKAAITSSAAMSNAHIDGRVATEGFVRQPLV